MTTVLALETSSPVLSVAFKKNDGLVREKKIEGFLTHAENLLPLIDETLKEENLSISEVSTFLIGRGPGSFTGLRVGFASLKGFLAHKQRDCYGGLCLDMVADNVDLVDGSHLAVAFDAFRQKFYVRTYLRKNGLWQEKTDPQAVDAHSWVKSLPPETYVTGNALDKYRKLFTETLQESQIFDKSFWYPRASVLISWFERLHSASDTRLSKLKTPEDYIPLYFRLSEAEERKKENANRS